MSTAITMNKKNLFNLKKSPKTFNGLIEKWQAKLEENRVRIQKDRESKLTVRPDQLEKENVMLCQILHDLKYLKNILEKGTN